MRRLFHPEVIGDQAAQCHKFKAVPCTQQEAGNVVTITIPTQQVLGYHELQCAILEFAVDLFCGIGVSSNNCSISSRPTPSKNAALFVRKTH